MAKYWCLAIMVLALAVSHATAARNAPSDAAGVKDQKNFLGYGGVGGYSDVGANGLPFGGAGGVLGGGGNFGGAGGGLGGGIGAGGGTSTGALPFP